jgi:hypothetical protein
MAAAWPWLLTQAIDFRTIADDRAAIRGPTVNKRNRERNAMAAQWHQTQLLP